MTQIATIGVYGFDLDSWLAALRKANVTLLLDVRQRRGVRGAEYAWANAKRLQESLREAGIDYQHIPELAPTTELRQAQYAEDDKQGVGKRNRQELAPVYVDGYTEQILEPYDLAPLVFYMPADSATALLCVEADPGACHRSLIAQRLSEEFGATIADIRPD